ncbi:hypothetical protein AKJ16_DCAP06333 [Drosera capensis]
MDGDNKSSSSSSAEKATGGVSLRLNSKSKNNKRHQKWKKRRKEEEVGRLRRLRRRYYMRNYPELGVPGMYARIALKHFNEENVAQGGVEYELVDKEEKDFRFSRQRNRWIHVNFKAKPKNAPDADAVLFFGEVQVPMGGDVIKCCVLNSGDPQGSCIGCRVIHPPSGFRPITWLPGTCDCAGLLIEAMLKGKPFFSNGS